MIPIPALPIPTTSKENQYVKEENKYVICAILQSEPVIKQIVRLSTGSSSLRARVQVDDLLNDVFVPVLAEGIQKEISESTFANVKKNWSLAQSRHSLDIVRPINCIQKKQQVKLMFDLLLYS